MAQSSVAGSLGFKLVKMLKVYFDTWQAEGWREVRRTKRIRAEMFGLRSPIKNQLRAIFFGNGIGVRLEVTL